MRKHYIDRLRNITILLLFVVHTFMIWNDFGEGFYIWQGGNKILSTVIVLINPWFMPILFVLAGISARYSLEKRTVKEFVMQRVNKLLIPFLGGLVLHIPFQTLYARKFHEDYEGGYIENWIYFFTHFTDLNGYDGAFTPAHLWFVLFLFVISMIALGVFRFIPYQKLENKIEKIPFWGLISLFILIWFMYYVGNLGGKSIGKFLMLYLLGYYVLSNDWVIDKLEKNLKWLVCICLLGMIVSAVSYYRFSFYGDLWVNFIGWIFILVMLAIGRKLFNEKTKFTTYFNQASYPIYILH